VSDWYPRDGRHDEVSFGPARSPWVLSQPKSVILLVGLASGLLIGVLPGVAVVGEALQGTDATVPTVVAGAIEKRDSGDVDFRSL